MRDLPDFRLPDKALDLVKEGFSEQYGARNLERTMDRLLGKKLADLLLSSGAAVGNMLRVDVDQGKISIAAILEKPA